MRQELATTVKATDPDGHFEAVGNPITGATLVELTAGEAVHVFTAQSGTATTTFQFLGTVTSFQITGTSTFSCDVFVSQDGVNFLEFDLSPATTSDIYMVDPYVNAYFKFTITANAGAVTVVMS